MRHFGVVRLHVDNVERGRQLTVVMLIVVDQIGGVSRVAVHATPTTVSVTGNLIELSLFFVEFIVQGA